MRGLASGSRPASFSGASTPAVQQDGHTSATNLSPTSVSVPDAAWQRLALGTRRWSPHLASSPGSRDARWTSGSGDPAVASCGPALTELQRGAQASVVVPEVTPTPYRSPAPFPLASSPVHASHVRLSPPPCPPGRTQAHCAPGCPHSRRGTWTQQMPKAESGQPHPGRGGPSEAGACTPHPADTGGPGPVGVDEACPGAFPFGERFLG